AIGRHCYEITHHQSVPCSGKEHPCPLMQTIKSRKPSQTTHVHLDKDDKQLFYSISSYPIFDDGNVVGAIELSRDITKDINLQKLMMLQEKLASIGRLSAGVAHEINNPLTTILTTSMLLQEDIEKDDPQYQELETITHEALRCRKIVSSLLDFARQTKPSKNLISPNDVVRESIVLTRKQAAFNDIAITERLADDIPDIYVDKDQLEQALINLILNSIEATGGGGNVWVETTFDAQQKELEITVRDNGEGIAADKIDKIFDPFYTSKENGTGLGLAITHGIIEQHGGAISVESKTGHGATFSIRLPINQEEKHAVV
ncbi:nitrogen regulation protein NR(II), partial [Thermodesulfobacteriota bacterium]